MTKIITMVLALTLTLSLVACGSSTGNGSVSTGNASSTEGTQTSTTASTQATEEEKANEPEIITVGVGQSIETENFKMTIESIKILDKYEYRTSPNSTSSLYVEDGYKMLAVQGVMENNGTKAISDSAFYKKVVVNDSYEVEGYDVRMGFERDKYFEIDPYTEQRYYLYINIPEKLAAQYETVTFTLGFKTDMSLLTTSFNSDGTKTVDADNWFAIKK